MRHLNYEWVLRGMRIVVLKPLEPSRGEFRIRAVIAQSRVVLPPNRISDLILVKRSMRVATLRYSVTFDQLCV